jgi:hypothetical protein
VTDPGPADRLAERGTDLLWRVQRTGDRRELAAAVEAFRRALAMRGPARISRAARRSYLAAALLTGIDLTGDSGGLEGAVRLARRAARQVTADDPEAAVVHANLGAALATACSYAWSSRRLTEAAAALRTAIALADPADTRLASYLSNLGGVLEMRYADRGRRADLDEAIIVGYAAAEAPGNEPVQHRGNLANSLLVRYRSAGAPDDLTAALDQYRLIEAGLTAGHPQAVAVLGRAGDAWALAYLDGRAPDGLDRAVESHRRALDAGPGDHGATVKLATSLRMRYDATGDGRDLDEIVGLARDASGRARKAGERAAQLSTLATCLLARFEHTGRMADLDDAADAAAEAVAAGPRRAPERRLRLANQAEILRVRALAGGRAADLDEAHAAAVRALSGVRRSDPAGPGYSINLANVLVARYRRHGLRADLDRAVERTVEAVLRTPATDPALPVRLSNLAELFRIRYEDRGDATDGAAAVELARSSVTAGRGQVRAAVWSTLGNALSLRYQRDGEPADAAEAVRAHRKALAAAAPGFAARHRLLGNLGAVYARRWERRRRRRDLDLAIDTFRQAADAAPADSADRIGQLTNVALMLTARYERYGRRADLAAATAAAGDASAITGPAPMLLAALMLSGDLRSRAGDWRSSAAAYGAAVDRLPEAAWLGADRTSRLAQLGRWPDLPGLATAAAIRADDLAGAVVAGEQGRSVLWSQMLSLRTDIDRLSSGHPRLAVRLDEVRAALDAAQP